MAGKVPFPSRPLRLLSCNLVLFVCTVEGALVQGYLACSSQNHQLRSFRLLFTRHLWSGKLFSSFLTFPHSFSECLDILRSRFSSSFANTSRQSLFRRTPFFFDQDRCVFICLPRSQQPKAGLQESMNSERRSLRGVPFYSKCVISEKSIRPKIRNNF